MKVRRRMAIALKKRFTWQGEVMTVIASLYVRLKIGTNGFMCLPKHANRLKEAVVSAFSSSKK